MCVFCILINFCLPPGSVLTGVGYGIRRISEICFSAGMFINLSLFFLFSVNFCFFSSFFTQECFWCWPSYCWTTQSTCSTSMCSPWASMHRICSRWALASFRFHYFHFFHWFSFALIQLLILLKQHFFLFIFSLFSQAFILLKEWSFSQVFIRLDND